MYLTETKVSPDLSAWGILQGEFGSEAFNWVYYRSSFCGTGYWYTLTGRVAPEPFSGKILMVGTGLLKLDRFLLTCESLTVDFIRGVASFSTLLTFS